VSPAAHRRFFQHSTGCLKTNVAQVRAHLPTFIPNMRDAVRLDEWLIARGLEEQKSTFTRREIQRNGTTETRDQTALEPALRHLEQRSRVRVRQVNKTVTIEINRRLLDQSATQME
jgi:hypothetical protein